MCDEQPGPWQVFPRSAAEAAFDAIVADRRHDELVAYPAAFENSWLHVELNKARNFKQWFKKGRTIGTLMTGIEQWLLKGRMPWTLHHSKPDHACLQPAADCARRTAASASIAGGTPVADTVLRPSFSE